MKGGPSCAADLYTTRACVGMRLAGLGQLAADLRLLVKSQIVIPPLQAATASMAPQAEERIKQVPPSATSDPCGAPAS